ncbi:leucyl/phenylalanyl-tRNA--protein transferase [Hypericibacter adhaerens]|uniref:Leucyl/phenylalanyl-tRNA--protein transferase n=2 Tax=Hypericibacter adhaerens TaxID=2602016 RepID=A0A5J6MYZ1_9PROT|nr:leucyl/phenylalanyl-tRNA--protein transferase [Hypericibacter adhaerens]
MSGRERITADMLLRAYACGVFPMAEGREDPELHWIDPKRRGVLPLDRFHLPHRLARTVRSNRYQVRCDTAFAETVMACAEAAPGRNETWINQDILRLMRQLFDLGYAHSVECWDQDRMVGGLYGVSLGGAFFGESMFSRARDASKVALVHLVLRLKIGGYRLLDTQFVTEHLKQFGAIEISRAEYQRQLAAAIPVPTRFYGVVPDSLVAGFTQSTTQMS